MKYRFRLPPNLIPRLIWMLIQFFVNIGPKFRTRSKWRFHVSYLPISDIPSRMKLFPAQSNRKFRGKCYFSYILNQKSLFWKLELTVLQLVGEGHAGYNFSISRAWQVVCDPPYLNLNTSLAVNKIFRNLGLISKHWSFLKSCAYNSR